MPRFGFAGSSVSPMADYGHKTGRYSEPRVRRRGMRKSLGEPHIRGQDKAWSRMTRRPTRRGPVHVDIQRDVWDAIYKYRLNRSAVLPYDILNNPDERLSVAEVTFVCPIRPPQSVQAFYALP